jgi:hypothetical protein
VYFAGWYLVKEAGPDTIRFAGASLGHQRHVCAFFNGAEEAFNVLAPFIRDGFLCNHRAIHLVSENKREAHFSFLRCEGIDTEALQRSGQLEVLSTVETYLTNGRFDQDRMVEAFTAVASGRKDAKYPLSRIVCDMDWAAETPDHLQDLIDFESRVNDLWSQHDDIVICMYDLAKFGGDTIVDILRTHPLVVIGGVLRENPFFVPPIEFIKELRERRSKKEEQSVAAE